MVHTKSSASKKISCAKRSPKRNLKKSRFDVSLLTNMMQKLSIGSKFIEVEFLQKRVCVLQIGNDEMDRTDDSSFFRVITEVDFPFWVREIFKSTERKATWNF
jgi:hypothetical protein